MQVWSLGINTARWEKTALRIACVLGILPKSHFQCLGLVLLCTQSLKIQPWFVALLGHRKTEVSKYISENFLKLE